jgi:hypothetical protein
MWQNRCKFTPAIVWIFWALPAWSIDPASTPATANAPINAVQLIDQSAQNLLALPALDAEFRFRIQLFEETLLGTGHYQQAGSEEDKLFRLDLKTQLEETVVSQQIIGNTQYLWLRQEGNFQPRPVVRVNLKQLKKITQEKYPLVPWRASPTALSVFSLPKQLTMLNAWFQFAPPQEAKVGDRLVWQIYGELKPELLKSQLLTTNPTVDQIPNAIRLTLGRDETLPLFPYRFEYLKRTESGDTRTLLTIDYYSVKLKPEMDPQLFEYFPGDQEVEDQTTLFMQKLGLR